MTAYEDGKLVLSYYEDQLWLSQFSRDKTDHELAQLLLDSCHFVESKLMTDDLSFLIDMSFKGPDKVAFFVERELKKNNGSPQRMYKFKKIKVVGRRKYKRQSYGAAIQSVQSKKLTSQKIGSEGLIANFLTKKIEGFRYKKRFFLQPTIEEIREKRINNIVIVSDLIGTGQRVIDMINSIWKSETIKSWHSYKLVKISVLCHSCTAEAEKKILSHKACVSILKVMQCPTINSSFEGVTKNKIKDLCERYGHYSRRPLGYEDSGVLVSFAHSIPNNCPAILAESYRSTKKSWNRLFRAPYKSGSKSRSRSEIFNELEKNTYSRLGFYYMQEILSNYKLLNSRREAILIAFLLDKGVRNKIDIVSFTKGPLDIISNMIKNAHEYGYLKLYGFQLRSEGRKIVKRLKKDELVHKKSLEEVQSFYYPNSLRTPKNGV